MTQINQNINPNIIQQLPVIQRQQVPQQGVRIPDYYYVPTDNSRSFKEIVEKNLIYEMVLKQLVEHPIPVLGTWLGLSLGLDAYAHACEGEYSKSLVAKAANFGDKIEESKFIQSKPVQSFLGIFRKGTELGGKAVKNSGILRAMKDTPTMPEWGMVKSQMFNQRQEVVQDFLRIADGLELSEQKQIKLKNIGLNKSEKEMLKKVFDAKSVSKIPETQAVNQVLLHRLGLPESKISEIVAKGEAGTPLVKQEILKTLGLKVDDIKAIKEDMFGKEIGKVVKACQKAKGKVKIGAGHFNWLGPLTIPFERTIGCDEVANKLHSMGKGARTATGRFTSKMMQMMHRGLTFGGGKMGALFFIAPILVEIGLNVKKADKDQKIGTAVGGFIESISWVFTFPIALRMLHAIGGIKNAGMGIDKVKSVINKKDAFNQRVDAGELIDKTKYKEAKKALKGELKKLKKVEGQNFLTRGLRKVAGWLTPDLGTIRSRKTGNILMDKVRQIPNFMKNVAGVPTRLAVWGLLSIGLLGGILTKCTTAIFGKSYDAMKQDENKEARKEQKKFLKEDLNKRLYAAQAEKQGIQVKKPQQAVNGKNNLATKGASGVLNKDEIPKVFKEKVDNYTYIPSSANVVPKPIKPGKADNYTYIPSSKNVIKPNELQNNKRSYIPSQAAANIKKTFDNSGLQSALDRAQVAENKALKILAGNFEGM